MRIVAPFAILCLLLLQGCIFARGGLGERIPEDAVGRIVKDETDRKTVVELLGAPDDIFEAGPYHVFHYFRYDSKLGYVLVLSRLNLASDNLYIFFDDAGIVKQVVSGNRTDRLAFQFWPFGD